jgi:hypothetical protein
VKYGVLLAFLWFFPALLAVFDAVRDPPTGVMDQISVVLAGLVGLAALLACGGMTYVYIKNWISGIPPSAELLETAYIDLVKPEITPMRTEHPSLDGVTQNTERDMNVSDSVA